MKHILVILGLLIFVPLALLYNAFSYGFVATMFADWFVYPVFPNFPKLNWIQFVGLSYFIMCIFPKNSTMIKDEFQEERIAKWIMIIIAPWFLLLAGGLIKLFL